MRIISPAHAAPVRRAVLWTQLIAGLGSGLGFSCAALADAVSDNSNELAEITVTARKKDETAMNVPVSITAFSQKSLENLNINSFEDYATKVPNLSFSYGTANWGFVDSRTVAIRGIQGFGTTGVYIDDTPVPDSLDPRVADIQQIEVDKGPQGTLFGQGSLGGVLRMITVQPTPGKDDIHTSAKFGGTSGAGSPDYSVDGAGSHTINDNLVVRLVGFYDHEGGFLHRDAINPNNGETLYNGGNYGANYSYGGSLAVRWLVNDSFDVGFRVMAQETDWHGWQAPYAPLPSFSIQNFTMDRTDDVEEMARDRYYLPSLTLDYRGSGYSLHESLSYFDRRATQIEDGSEGTRDALIADWSGSFAGINDLTGENQAFPWTQVVSYRRTVSETRLNFQKTSFGLSGVAGLYLSRSFSDTELDSISIPLIQQLGLNTNSAVGGSYCRTTATDTSCPTYGSGLGWTSQQPSYHKDQALFGELYYDFYKFELTVGGRYYHQTQTGHELAAGALNFAYLNLAVPDTHQSGFDPKLALRFNFTPTSMAYLSYSKGFRAGGAGVPLPSGPDAFFAAIHQTVNTPTTYNSDTVENFELGGKVEFMDSKLVLTAAVFQMNWDNIQQTIIAPESYITLIVNAGDARVRGGELEIEARPAPFVDLHAGVGIQEAKISAGALYWQPTGSRVYQVPDVTATVSARFMAPINEKFSSFLQLDGSYVGNSVSGTAGCQLNTATVQYFPCPAAGAANGDLTGTTPTRAGYSVLNASLGLEWGKSQLSLYGTNLTNARPNLGDINPESYAKHDPESGFLIPRVATLRPFGFGLEFRQRY
jgi:iron complex outermembrane recepter protein